MNRIYLILLIGTGLSCSKPADKKTLEESSAVVAETISAAEFLSGIKSTEKAVVLDVRTPEEFASGAIEGAMNIDFRAPDFESKIETLDKDAPYYIYCASGRRSSGALELMSAHQFRQVYNLSGGITQWSKDGLPVVKP